MSGRPKQKLATAGSPSSFRVIQIFLFAAWAIFVSWHFHSDIPWVGLWRDWASSPWTLIPSRAALQAHYLPILIAAWLSFSILGIGHAALSRFGIRFDNFWEALALTFAGGYGVLGTVLFFLAAAHLWHPSLFAVLLALGSVIAIAFVRGLCATRQNPECRMDRSTIVLLAVVLLVFAHNARLALAPETFFDALTYHLALPNLYLTGGGMLPTPENSFSGIPSLPEMVNGAALAFDRSGVASNLTHSSLSLWIAAALMGLATRLRQPQAGAWAAASFALIPVVWAEGFRVSVGLEWTLFETCFALALTAAIGARPDDPARRRWVVVAGMLLGFCMCTKYPAFALLLTLFAIASRREAGTADEFALLRPREALALTFVGLACVLPWLARNAAYYGNPVYPYFHGFFRPDALPMPDWRQVGTPSMDFARFFSLGGVWHYLTHPWRFVTSPEDVAGSMGPQVLAVLPAILLTRTRGLESRLAAFCLLAWLPLSLVSEVPRFFMPHFPLLILLLCQLIARIEPRPLRSAARAFHGLTLAPLFFGLPLMTVSQGEKLAVFSGRLGVTEYLSRPRVSYPTPPFAAIDFLNRKTEPDDKILFIGDARAFYLKRPYVAATLDQRPLIELWTKGAADASRLHDRVLREGVTYILINYGEMLRTRRNFLLTLEEKAALDSFMQRHTETVFRIKEPGELWLEVRRVLDGPAAPPEHGPSSPAQGRASAGGGPPL